MKYADDTALVSIWWGRGARPCARLSYQLVWQVKPSPKSIKNKGNVDAFQKSGFPQLCFCHFDKRKANRVKWDMWTDQICTKSQQRMLHLKKLLTFQVSSKVLQKFIVLFFWKYLHLFCRLLVWQCHTGTTKRVQLIISLCSKLLGRILPSMESIYRQSMPPAPFLYKKTKHFPLCLRLLKSLTASTVPNLSLSAGLQKHSNLFSS